MLQRENAFPPIHNAEAGTISHQTYQSCTILAFRMLWTCGPNINNLSSVTVRNFGCGLRWRRVWLLTLSAKGLPEGDPCECQHPFRVGGKGLEGGGLPNMLCLVASSVSHLRSQCSIVCGSSLQRRHRLSAGGISRRHRKWAMEGCCWLRRLFPLRCLRARCRGFLCALVSIEGSSGPVERLGGTLGDGSLETGIQLP